MAWHRNHWRALGNTVIKLMCPTKMLGISCVASELVASREGLSSMQYNIDNANKDNSNVA
jgi:hypothetical protein